MQLKYFIIGGCTIQVSYSRIMPRVVLALDIAEVKKSQHCSWQYLRLNDCHFTCVSSFPCLVFPLGGGAPFL
jgi:hypothetical protein